MGMAIHVCIIIMVIDISNKCTLSKYMESIGLNLYFNGTRAYMVVAHAFAAFSGSYILGIIGLYMYGFKIYTSNSLP